MEFSSPWNYVIYGWVCGFVFHAAIHFIVIACNGLKIFNFWHGESI